VFLASLSIGSNCAYFATDINFKACLATRKTAQVNGVHVNVIHTSLVDAVAKGLAGKVDFLVFNPPYVPTEEDELGRDDLYCAWAGGLDGRVVIDQLLPQVHGLLSEGGCFYLQVIIENRPKQIASLMEQKFGLKYEGVVLQRRAQNELLHVLKFSKPKSEQAKIEAERISDGFLH